MQELLRSSSQLTAIDSFSGFKVDFFSISAVHILKINFSCQFNSLKYWFCQKKPLWKWLRNQCWICWKKFLWVEVPIFQFLNLIEPKTQQLPFYYSGRHLMWSLWASPWLITLKEWDKNPNYFLTKYATVLKYNWDLFNLGQFDPINQTVTLTVFKSFNKK